jgi:hypothetical protein
MFALNEGLLTAVILTEEAKLTLQIVGIQGFQKALADGLAATAHLVPWTAQPRHSCTPCARPTAHIVAELRYANSRHLPAVTNYRNILFDIQVHAQDIAIPLGRDYPMQPEAARAGPDRVWTMAWPFWVAGAGKELRGPVGMILLLLTGRIATALPHMSGPGVQTIASKSGLRRRTRSERCGVNDCLRGLTPSQPRRFHRP